MKVRDSGMPEEGWWSTFFDPEKALRTFSIDGNTGDILEFGCGYGTFTIPAARLVSGTVHALDIEPEMIEMVREKCAREGIGNVRLLLRDFVAGGTGLPDNSVDAALLFNILHHEEPVALLKEAFRVLRPGGIAAVIHWNYDPTTPRGPSMDIRPRPEQCMEWGRKAGFAFDEEERFDLKPYHYGLLFRKPGL
ncbi:class I SAM-dependent methyltransferase [Geobacter sp.]|uniref:class I SAM-dependent methyltransferase n=1 Tax=Geobacter sp. TaxID=46610 RepID=UPI002610E069|nr:class I SAM-dependent methyltransferase [Geobacter sp.]